MIFSDYETVAKVHGGKGERRERPFTKTPRPFPQETFAGVSTRYLPAGPTAGSSLPGPERPGKGKLSGRLARRLSNAFIFAAMRFGALG